MSESAEDPLWTLIMSNMTRIRDGARVVARGYGPLTLGEADDLAHNAVLRILMISKQRKLVFNSDDEFVSFVYETLRYVALEHFRKARRLLPLPNSDTSSEEETPAKILLLKEQRELLQEIMSELRPRNLEVLLLHHAGLSHAEISDLLGITPGAVRSLLHRTRHKMRKMWSVLENRKELSLLKIGRKKTG